VSDDRVDLCFDLSTLAGDPVLARHRVRAPGFMVPEDAPPGAVAVAREVWEDRARSEYIGVMVTRRLHGLLVDLNAPLDLQEVAVALTLQEQRHASLCAAAARALGSDGVLSFDVDELRQARSGDSLSAAREDTLTMFAATFAVGEVAALALLEAELAAVTPSPFRDALALIASDEVLHARVGPLVLAAARRGETEDWLPWSGDDVARRLVQGQLQAMRARDVVEADHVARAAADPEIERLLLRLGVRSPAAFRASYFEALDHVVPERLRKFGLDALA
jgi:hypothetical protein